jgi:hypothetical protein
MSKYVIISFLFLFVIRVLISVAIGSEANLYSKPLLLARTGAGSSFNLPLNSHLQDVTPQINDRLDVAFKIYLSITNNEQAVWSILGGNEYNFEMSRGQLIALAPEDYAVSDIDLNNNGEMVFSFFNEEGSEGLYFYNDITKSKKILEGDLLDLKYFSTAKINDESQIFFKGVKKNKRPSELLSFNAKKNTKPIALVSEGEGISYLFALGVLDEGAGLVFKTRLGQLNDLDENRPDQIVRYTPSGLEVVAEDRDCNASSSFISFYNFVVPGPSETIVFMAQTDIGMGLFLYHPSIGITSLIYEGQQDLKSIQLFAPVVRLHESTFEVIFRGINSQGFETIYFLQHNLLNKQNKLETLLVQNQKVLLDNGESYLTFFSGGLGLNNLGDLVLHALFSGNQEGILLLNRLQE